MPSFNEIFKVSEYQENDAFTYYEVANKELANKTVVTGDLVVTSSIPDAVLTFCALAAFEHDSSYNWQSIYENDYNYNDFAVEDFFRKNNIKTVVEFEKGEIVGFFQLN